MKKIILTIFCIIIIFIAVYKADDISNKLTNLINNEPIIIIKDQNKFAKNTDYLFLKRTDNFIPYSYNDLKSIFYTVIDNGWSDFTFYCPHEYETCLDDIVKIYDKDNILEIISDYVHPYNTPNSIRISNDYRQVNIAVEYKYTNEEIKFMEEKIDEIMKNTIDTSKSDYDNIKAVHDYIINTTKYDDTIDKDRYLYELLKNHVSFCNGYADVMAIILNKLNIPNYKISSIRNDEEEGHIWNAVYINNEWKHLDLTWDDPVSSDGENYLFHYYFLVDTEELKKVDSGDVNITDHVFSKNIYLEFNEIINTIN